LPKIYVHEVDGFPEIQAPGFIDTGALPADRVELIEWSPIGGILIADCIDICVRFEKGGLIKGYIGPKVTPATIFERRIVNAVNLSDNVKGNYDKIRQLDAQYKEICRLMGRKEKKQMLAVLNIRS
jgi:hypothetical protein